MTILRGKITAAASAISTQLAIDTNLTADSTSGWQILNLKLFVPGFYAINADCRIALVLTKLLNSGTANDQTLPSSHSEIARAELAAALVGTGASYSQVWSESIALILGERITVQPIIYLNLDNIAGFNSQDAYYELEYDIVKLNNSDVVKMLLADL